LRKSLSHPINSTPSRDTGKRTVVELAADEVPAAEQERVFKFEEDDQAKVAFEKLSNLTAELMDWSPIRNDTLDRTTIRDVQEVIVEIKALWESENRPKEEKLLTLLISRTIYLSNTMDVIIQGHPEYVGLAWGSLKVLILVRSTLSISCIPLSS